MKMNKKTKGAWLVHHTNKLQQVTNPGSYEHIFEAGKCAVLLSALSASRGQSLSMDRVKALAQASGVNSLELNAILQRLEEHQLISQGKHGIDVLGVTTPAILGHAAGIFDAIGPSKGEEAGLELAERVSNAPAESNRVSEFIGDQFELSQAQVKDLFSDSEEIGFVDCEIIDDTKKIYFNGNLFRREEMEKIEKVLHSLSSSDERKVIEFNELLRKNACVDESKAVSTLGQSLFRKLQSIGMYDINTVSNPYETRGYITRPSAFSKFGNPLVDDAMDLAKAFVSSLTYGMTRSDPGRGRITMFEALMKKLIRGEEVGPATAIGQDYSILEMRGVVRVRPDGGLFHMSLLKKEVGELALQAITQGDISEHSLPQFPGAAVTRYKGPEDNRTEIRHRRITEAARGKHETFYLL